MVGIITAAGPVPPEVPGDYDMLRATFQVVHGFHFPHLKAGPLSFYVGRAEPVHPGRPAAFRRLDVEESACFVVTGRRCEACTSMAPAASIKLKAA
jgi:hypothetical protein